MSAATRWHRSSSARGIGGERHVFRGVEALIAGTVELAAEAVCLVIVRPCCVILKVQD
jgi:hypothetical protein